MDGAKEYEVKVDLKKLPKYTDLSTKVQEIVKSSSWFEKYGVDLMILAGTVPASIFALWCLSHNITEEPFKICLGIFLMGCVHSIATNKSAHLSSHGALCEDPERNVFFTSFLVEFLGSFSSYLAYDIHIKSHHPHTNIIGLGDSSTWRAPFVPAYLYMFATPLLVPVLIPLVSITELIRLKEWRQLARYLVVASSGLALQLAILMWACSFSLLGATLCLYIYRAVFAIPYIHVNIFQHIGLPMYSQKNRPHRVYQMATGCLNLSRNPVLDVVFGHSLINCHVEHHLFPRLSDYMCLKVKPVVSQFLKESGLPYNEDTYLNRMNDFIVRYEELMVKTPPITHFVGLQ